jgi:hypothetical protein
MVLLLGELRIRCAVVMLPPYRTTGGLVTHQRGGNQGGKKEGIGKPLDFFPLMVML